MNKRITYLQKAMHGIRRKFFLPLFLREMKQLEIGGLSAGNAVRLITEGDDFFDSVLTDIKNAKKSINLETFIYADDALGWKIAEEIVKRAKKGVEVNIMYDAFGSLGTSGEIFTYLRKNGAIEENVPKNLTPEEFEQEFKMIVEWKKQFTFLGQLKKIFRKLCCLHK